MQCCEAASELQPRAATVEDDSAACSVGFITEKPIVTIRVVMPKHDTFCQFSFCVCSTQRRLQAVCHAKEDDDGGRIALTKIRKNYPKRLKGSALAYSVSQ
jgi:hypothetical protein